MGGSPHTTPSLRRTSHAICTRNIPSAHALPNRSHIRTQVAAFTAPIIAIGYAWEKEAPHDRDLLGYEARAYARLVQSFQAALTMLLLLPIASPQRGCTLLHRQLAASLSGLSDAFHSLPGLMGSVGISNIQAGIASPPPDASQTRTMWAPTQSVLSHVSILRPYVSSYAVCRSWSARCRAVASVAGETIAPNAHHT